MQRLDRTVLHATAVAPSLPNMYQSLSMRQIAIRRGEVSLIAGQPASGKSTIALAMAVRASVPTLYVSADTHAHTMGLRLIAMLTATEQNVVEEMMTSNREWAAEMLTQASNIRWCFDSAPSIKSVEEELEAHVELFSRAPELVVIDNLTDMIVDGDEWSGMRTIMKDFKFLAREYDTAFLVLHHTSEAVQSPEGTCPPRHALQGKVAATPALVLTIAQSSAGFLGVCPVKNRYGPSNPSGSDPTWLAYNPASMQVNEVERAFQ